MLRDLSFIRIQKVYKNVYKNVNEKMYRKKFKTKRAENTVFFYVICNFL